MSRTSYGFIAFKIKSDDTDEVLIEKHTAAVKAMTDALKEHGGELTTMNEVMEKSMAYAAGEADALGHGGIGDIANGR